jgi:C-terminal processing protease CtpA/Prc
VTHKDGNVILTLQKVDAAHPFTLSVRTADPRTKLIGAADALHIPVALFRSHPTQLYWRQFLPESGTLFIQYNSCSNDPQLPFSDFAAKVLTDADAQTLKRVLIDLRFNGGGDSRIIRPLKDGLAARLNKIGPIYVLIGPRTFSSAVDNAMELRSSVRAKLAGEPTGGKPSSYGEMKFVELPNSKLKVQFTSKFFGSRKASEAGELAPDIVVRRTLAEALAGRDPVLEAVLR